MIGVGTFETTPRMKELVNEVLDSGRISYGDKSREFESTFAKIHDCKHAVLSNSGTSALHVALQSLKEMYGWKDGDKVVVPAVTFVATINVVLHNNLVPVFADVDNLTYNIDPSTIAVDERTRCIIPVHLFGQPANMSIIKTIAGTYGLKVIEDSCESMFAMHKGLRVGSMSDIGCFSTYVAHLISTGVGGICTTNNPSLASRLRSLVNHGRDGIYISIDDDDNVDSGELKEIVERRFRFESVGHSFRTTELESALGLAQLETWPEMIAARAANANSLTKMLDVDMSDVLQTPFIEPFNSHSFMMYPIVLRDEPKWDLCNYLEVNGVETREMLPITNQPVYKQFFEEGRRYPMAEWINESGFYVGCHQGLDENDMTIISELIHKFYGR